MAFPNLAPLRPQSLTFEHDVLPQRLRQAHLLHKHAHVQCSSSTGSTVKYAKHEVMYRFHHAKKSTLLLNLPARSIPSMLLTGAPDGPEEKRTQFNVLFVPVLHYKNCNAMV